MILKYKEDKEVIFDEASHTYSKNGIKYTGCNELLKPYFVEFNKGVAKFCAGKGNYTGMTETQVLKQWDDNKNNSITKGKMIHKIIELYIKNEYLQLYTLLLDNKEYKPYYEMVLKFFTPLPSDQAEILVSNDKYRLAGQIDFLGYYNGELCIIDWKTNKEIKQDSTDTMLEPFNHFKSCDYNKYVFQLNVYNKILKLAGLEVKHLYLGHITEDGIKLIKLPMISAEIDKLFELRLKAIARPEVVINRKKKPFNAFRFGMCCNQAHDELTSRIFTEQDYKDRIKELYYMYEELEQEIQEE